MHFLNGSQDLDAPPPPFINSAPSHSSDEQKQASTASLVPADSLNAALSLRV
eukprot:CAMPEP_0202716724 /NCGR_PEP_ID=MMETSP1385-20130828/104198_1 /ASSEMBLY_ACC=CAM_ASM_000861 /TAXON_ID=933848 /ORGANISM="Elphidium margaritaceum" /LENGTH=51 /DNA_ID=CAMNT_0049378613 /DNA_START=1 /DNA_END=152 /DNA_ORIENTATION=+